MKEQVLYNLNEQHFFAHKNFPSQYRISRTGCEQCLMFQEVQDLPSDRELAGDEDLKSIVLRLTKQVKEIQEIVSGLLPKGAVEGR